MDDRFDDVLYFIDLPDERVCLKVPKIPESMKHRSPFEYQRSIVEARQDVTNIIYDPGPHLSKIEPPGDGSPH